MPFDSILWHLVYDNSSGVMPTALLSLWHTHCFEQGERASVLYKYIIGMVKDKCCQKSANEKSSCYTAITETFEPKAKQDCDSHICPWIGYTLSQSFTIYLPSSLSLLYLTPLCLFLPFSPSLSPLLSFSLFSHHVAFSSPIFLSLQSPCSFINNYWQQPGPLDSFARACKNGYV
jgi:hypothetical protein